MNLSRISNSYHFKDYNNELFNVHSSDHGLPNRISDSLRYSEDSNVRLINDWVLSISQNSMLIWRYNSSQKNIISACKEYFLPNPEISYSAKQGTIIYDYKTNQPLSCIIVGDDAAVRFWPELSSNQEYIDQKIPNIYNDACLMVEKIQDDVLVFIFRSMKLIIADLKDYTDAGISFKQFIQPTGFINGISRCISSFFVYNYNHDYPFINVKANKNAKNYSELLLMVDNNIDSLCLDVLQNGQYTKAVLNHSAIRRALHETIKTKSSVECEHFKLKNFDLCRNICYVVVELADPSTELIKYFLIVYNRNLDLVDSIAKIDGEFTGDIEIFVIDDDIQNGDQPCLLAALKDSHKILIVEVLTGNIKAQLDASDALKSHSPISKSQSIIGWTCPNLSGDFNTIIVAVLANRQIVSIKQKINPFVNNIVGRLQTEANLSNSSFTDQHHRGITQQGDIERINSSFMSKLNPMALSTPKFKLDQMGDRLADESFNSLNPTNVDLNMSMNLENIFVDQGVFGEFKKCVVLFWLGYKSQATRLITSIIETAQIDPEVSIPLLAMQIAREIIDEHPTKDPRWTKLKSNLNKFCYSNKSLILTHQLNAKLEALQNLLLMLKENNFELFGSMGNIAPMSVYKCLLMQGSKSELQFFGDFKISWSLVNCVGLGGELLEFVRIFNEIMLNSQSPEINKIMSTTCQHILPTQKKLSAIEIFSQEVSLVPSFIENCCNYLNERRDNLADLKNYEANVSEQIVELKRTCQLIARIISSCLRASLSYRNKFESSFVSTNFACNYSTRSTAAPCWITEQQPIGVSESILDMVVNLVDFSRVFENNQIFESVSEIVSVFLEFQAHRIEWMKKFSRNSEEEERLIELLRVTRYQLIEKLVEDGKSIEKSLELAENFQDFHWIITLCEVLDNQSTNSKKIHLEYYLRKFADDGFSEYVLDWYQDKLKQDVSTNRGKLLAKIQLILEIIQKLEGPNMSSRVENSNSSLVIGKFLDRAEVQGTRWLHEIEIEDFKQAAKTLVRLGEAEHELLGRKKTLLSLAKLSCLAADEDIEESDANQILRTTHVHLKLIKFQENVPSKTMSETLGFSVDSRRQPLIEVGQLVKLFLESVKPGEDVDISPIVRSLELLYFSLFNKKIAKLSDSEYDNLLSTIWSKSVLLDDWCQFSPDNVDSTVISKVVRSGLEAGLPMNKLIPDVDRLFENELLKELSQNSEFVYSVQRSFEALKSAEDEFMEE